MRDDDRTDAALNWIICIVVVTVLVLTIYNIGVKK